MKKVLITGMSGLIGGLLGAHLQKEGGYELTALNRSKVEGVNCVQADISDLEAIKGAFQNQDVVVHLAAYLGSDDWPGQLNGNIVGTYNVFEAARLAGAKRVVYASSGNTIRGYEKIEPYKALVEGRYNDIQGEVPLITPKMVKPVGIYGAAKIFGEALASYYSDAYGMSFLCVRIGSVEKNNVPAAIRERTTYLSHDDITQVLHKCIDAPDDLMYDVFLATSDNKYGYRDLSHTREVLGYKPKDSADSYFE
jgi:nucleoside-diphosphate-sugar epimerase